MQHYAFGTRLIVTGAGFVFAGFLGEMVSRSPYAHFFSMKQSYRLFRSQVGSRSEALRFVFMRSIHYMGILMFCTGIIVKLVGV